MFYAFIENNEINGKGQYPIVDSDIISVEITEEIYDDLDRYIWDGTEVILNPNYDQEQADLREADFKSKFFNVTGYGWYRREPKGYQSAVESMNVLYNIANIEVEGQPQGIQAGLIIFYQQPNFTNPEECTEEWLVQHQIVQPAMTKDQFMLLYMAFMTAWNRAEHQ